MRENKTHFALYAGYKDNRIKIDGKSVADNTFYGRFYNEYTFAIIASDNEELNRSYDFIKRFKPDIITVEMCGYGVRKFMLWAVERERDISPAYISSNIRDLERHFERYYAHNKE